MKTITEFSGIVLREASRIRRSHRPPEQPASVAGPGEPPPSATPAASTSDDAEPTREASPAGAIETEGSLGVDSSGGGDVVEGGTAVLESVPGAVDQLIVAGDSSSAGAGETTSTEASSGSENASAGSS